MNCGDWSSRGWVALPRASTCASGNSHRKKSDWTPVDTFEFEPWFERREDGGRRGNNKQHTPNLRKRNTHTHNTTRMTNEQTHKPSGAHETQHHIPSVKVIPAGFQIQISLLECAVGILASLGFVAKLQTRREWRVPPSRLLSSPGRPWGSLGRPNFEPDGSESNLFSSGRLSDHPRRVHRRTAAISEQFLNFRL